LQKSAVNVSEANKNRGCSYVENMVGKHDNTTVKRTISQNPASLIAIFDATKC
jgi:hypothetical protein